MIEIALPCVDVEDASFSLSGKVTSIIGGPKMILRHQYDAAQLWFGFMDGVLLHSQTRDKAHSYVDFFTTSAITSDIFEMGVVDHKRIYRSDYHTFVPEEPDVPQLVLPFHEHRRIRGRDLISASIAEFPSFNRDEDGNLMQYEVPALSEASVLEWLDENCIGRYALYRGRVVVEREEDAVGVRLRL